MDSGVGGDVLALMLSGSSLCSGARSLKYPRLPNIEFLQKMMKSIEGKFHNK
jgi:hypothetical protein